MTAQCRPAETALLTRDVFALLDAPAQSVGDIGSLEGQRAMSSAAAHPYGLACDLKGTPAKSPQDARWHRCQRCSRPSRLGSRCALFLPRATQQGCFFERRLGLRLSAHQNLRCGPNQPNCSCWSTIRTGGCGCRFATLRGGCFGSGFFGSADCTVPASDGCSCPNASRTLLETSTTTAWAGTPASALTAGAGLFMGTLVS